MTSTERYHLETQIDQIDEQIAEIESSLTKTYDEVEDLKTYLTMLVSKRDRRLNRIRTSNR